jgi:hypothetical protein
MVLSRGYGEVGVEATKELVGAAREGAGKGGEGWIVVWFSLVIMFSYDRQHREESW